jgi:hypothetical protein
VIPVNRNALKIIACFTMLIDHIGFLLLPDVIWLRYIGRLAMPLFAFFIAEGCRYTKNRARHFCLLAGLALICEIGVRIAVPENELSSVLVTFTLATLLIYALQLFKNRLFTNAPVWQTLLCGLLFVGGIVGTHFFTEHVQIDYGFWGVLAPVFVSVFDFRRDPAPSFLKKTDVLPVRILCLVPALIMLATNFSLVGTDIQWYAFLSLPLLLLYGGKRGKWNMKYFFYIFYPTHMVLLYGIHYFL